MRRESERANFQASLHAVSKHFTRRQENAIRGRFCRLLSVLSGPALPTGTAQYQVESARATGHHQNLSGSLPLLACFFYTSNHCLHPVIPIVGWRGASCGDRLDQHFNSAAASRRAAPCGMTQILRAPFAVPLRVRRFCSYSPLHRDFCGRDGAT